MLIKKIEMNVSYDSGMFLKMGYGESKEIIISTNQGIVDPHSVAINVDKQMIVNFLKLIEVM